jgi:hypothetical protein
MDKAQIKENILRTLLYYDIFSHPLKPEEIYTFLPMNSVPEPDMLKIIKSLSAESDNHFAEKDGFVYVKPNDHFISQRISKERYSRKMWLAARLVTHVIKRFPFVRAVLVSGSLSKNSSAKASDLDFMVITKSGRLWIARTLLMFFKKAFLFNSYKFFCINYFITEDHLEIEDKNYYTATEIAHIKATFNTKLMNGFISANKWICNYFPNYRLCGPFTHSAGFKVNNRKSIMQKILELPFGGAWGSKLDARFRGMTQNFWNRKYGYVSEPDRRFMFRTTPQVSKAHPGNMQKKILEMYCRKLKQFDLECDTNE